MTYTCCPTSCVCIQSLIHTPQQVAKYQSGACGTEPWLSAITKGLQTDKTKMAQKHIHFARTVREITNKSFKNKETKSQPSLKTGYLCHLLLLIPNKRLLVGNILKLIDSIKINFNLKTPSQQMHLYQKRVATGW